MTSSQRLRIVNNLVPREDDFDGIAVPPAFPELDPVALHGIAGDFVRIAREHTEADDAGLLFSILTALGCVLGGDQDAPHKMVGATPHHARLFVNLVGQTGRGRKGASEDPVDAFREAIARTDVPRMASGGPPDSAAVAADPFSLDIVHRGGLSSGEGLINRIRDEREIRKRGGIDIDPGCPDKRLLVIQSEFGGVLRMRQREANTLSDHLRNAWDGKRLAPLIKNDPISATRPHVCVIGHITQEELMGLLDNTSVFNGFANRFIWVMVRRRRLLPNPPVLDPAQFADLADRFRDAFVCSRGRRYEWSADTCSAWDEIYHALAARTDSGLVGAMLSRAEAYITRLALLFAVLDGGDQIGLEHLAAASACWEYADSSVKYIFGATGDTEDAMVINRAHHLLHLLAQAPGGVLDGRGIKAAGNDAFDKATLETVAGYLVRNGLATVIQEQTGGRPRTVWTITDLGRARVTFSQ